jgi:uncharacterized protein
MSDIATARALLESLGAAGHHFTGDDVAHLEVSGNEVVGSHLVPGLEMDIEQIDDGIEAHIRLREGVKLANPVHICFGMLPTDGL